MSSLHATYGELRYELKYLSTTPDLAVANARVLAAPGPFREEYPARVVNSIYLDGRRLETYQDHVDGLGARAKVRLRWYGERDAWGDGAVAIEVKRREGAMIRKQVVPGERRGWQKEEAAALALALAADVPDLAVALRLRDMQPVLRVSYLRRYYVTPKGLRITLDTAIRVAPADGVRLDTSIPIVQPVLCEIKFAPTLRDDAAAAVQVLAWPRIKHSKYVRGMRAAGLV